MAISVIVAEDHLVVRLGIRGLFDGTDFQVVDEAASGPELIQKLEERNASGTLPNLVLLDVRMRGGDGLSAIGKIKQSFPSLPVVIFSNYDNPTFVARAVALGASGYVLKTEAAEQLLQAMRVALRGELSWSREELRRVTGALSTPRVVSDIEVPLTQRESEVLGQLANGLTNKEIALALGISYETVKEHVQHILHKIGVSDRTQAAVWAVRNGLV